MPEESRNMFGGNRFRLLSRRPRNLTIEFATQILGLAPVPGERPLRRAHVANLSRVMREGRFRPELTDIATCVDLQTGIKHRINSQHTCHGRLQAPDADLNGVTLLEYEADDLQAVRDLYATFDQGASRTKGHTLTTYLTDNGPFVDVASRTVKVIGAGYMFWLWDNKGTRGRQVMSDVAAGMLGEHVDLCRRVVNFFQGDVANSSHRIVFRAPVLGAWFATFGKVPTKAGEFWDPVRTGVGLTDRADPRLVLRNYLAERGLVGSNTPLTGGLKPTGEETMYRGCLHGWNAWREGRTLRGIQVRDTDDRPDVR